jgi:hypothetical protein
VAAEKVVDLFRKGETRLSDTRRVFNLLFGRVLSELDTMIYRGELRPKHGPGSTADSLYGNQKWTLPSWHERLETLFPYVDYGIPSYKYWEEQFRTKFIMPEDEPPAKLTAVPKTHGKPRLISIEPTVMQYIQQAISVPLRAMLERDSLCKHFIGFEQQWPNQAMACIGSEDGSLATLDLSEASDRIPNWLIEDLVQDFPHFSEAIEACRSSRVQLPSGEIHSLRKFASMGSALTFPMEAMVFVAVVFEAMFRASNIRPTLGAFRRYQDQVRVYGDDIIVPTHMAETVIDSLETFGFKVNRNKSFWTGSFRESCGKEFWEGRDVSIVRFRKRLPTSRRDVDEIVSTSATRNLFYKAGMVKLASRLDDLLLDILDGYYPWVAETSPILGRIHQSGLYQIDGYNDKLHCPFVKGFAVVPRIPDNEISEHHALLKCFQGESPPKRFPEDHLEDSARYARIDRKGWISAIEPIQSDPEHLKRSGRPFAVSIKRGKGLPF